MTVSGQFFCHWVAIPSACNGRCIGSHPHDPSVFWEWPLWKSERGLSIPRGFVKAAAASSLSLASEPKLSPNSMGLNSLKSLSFSNSLRREFFCKSIGSSCKLPCCVNLHFPTVEEMSGWVQSFLLEAPVPLPFPARTQAGLQRPAKVLKLTRCPVHTVCCHRNATAYHCIQIRALQSSEVWHTKLLCMW